MLSQVARQILLIQLRSINKFSDQVKIRNYNKPLKTQ